MHNHPSIVALAFVGLLAASCATTPAAKPASGWTGDEAAIRAATAASSAAWNRGDIKGHLAIYDEATTFMTTDGPRPGVAPIEEAFLKKYFNNGVPKQSLAFSQVAVRRLGDDAALETGRFQLSGGGLPEQSGWFTLVWKRTPEGWRVIHDHSS
jgi:uncharacterized protein (TIGR02246 family)